MTAHVAVDLGATSGRVSLGSLKAGRLELLETARFENNPVVADGRLAWDLGELFARSVDGIRRAVMAAADNCTPVATIGIDSWGVDFATVGPGGAEMGVARHYRSAPDDSVGRVRAALPANVSYAATGVQQLPINTIYQLSDAALRGELRNDRTALLIPDLWVYALTGTVGAELTIASTTEMLDARTLEWSASVAELARIPLGCLPPLFHTGSSAGPVTPHMRTRLGADQEISVVRVAEHDTASAVLALPVDEAQQNFAFISCGSWALVGQELASPVLTEDARLAGFTNEKGAFGSTLFMRNLAGLWLLEECVREWNSSRTEPLSAVAVVAEAAAVQPLRSVFDVAHPDFLRPGDITGRIAAHCRRSGQAVPETPAQFARCILESLAIAYRLTIDHCEKLSGQPVDIVHITGGGSHNELLCQFTADACDRRVMAGPAEGTSAGNILVQMMAAGTIADKAHARAVVHASSPARSFSPQTGSEITWQAVTRRIEDLSHGREEIVT